MMITRNSQADTAAAESHRGGARNGHTGGSARLRSLSVGQRRLWLLNRIDPASAAYNVTFALRMTGQLDAEALQRALCAVLDRHDVLRTTFPVIDGEPRQMVAPRGLRMRITAVEAPGAAEESIRRLVNEHCAQPFDLATGPLLRPLLLRISPGEHVFAVAIHHIVCDAWSLGVFRRELAGFYNAFATGAEPDVPPASSFQFADFAEWEVERIRKHASAQSRYWAAQLSGDLPATEMPTDGPRSAQRSSRGSRYVYVMPAALRDAVLRFSRAKNVTPFMTLLAALDVLVHRYTGQKDVLIGAPIANRTRAEVENLIGFFTNTIVLRSRIAPDDTVDSLLRNVRDACLGAYENAELPFESVAEALTPRRDLVSNPLFQIMMQYRPAGPAPARFVGLEATQHEVDTGAAKFDLNFTFVDRDQQLTATIEYSTDSFELSTVQRIAKHLNTVLDELVRNPGARVRELSLLDADEYHQIVVDWNQTAADFSRDETIHRMFKAQVARNPGAVAAISGKRQLTYSQLDAQSDRLAGYLAESGCGPGSVVAVCLERSIEAVAALLGVLKAGAAYLPLDPALPKARLAFQLQDSGAVAVLTQQSLRHLFPVTGARLVCLDAEQEEIFRATRPARRLDVAASSPAYLIYTSGSTGTPKGVLVGHRSVVNLLTDMRRRLRVCAQDRFLFLTTICFDIAIVEVFLPLISGASFVTAGTDDSKDPAQLARLVAGSGVTLMQATPATWRMLIERKWQGGRRLRVISGGEALKPDLASELLRRCGEVWNMYGPTETTVYSTVFRVHPKLPISIGSPISNTHTYILDEAGNPVPVGVPGELCIAGDGVAIGYMNRPELTAARFIENPFDKQAPILYKTGDRARYLEDGNIEYLGRFDQQVKIRGFRVETGEVEQVLRRHGSVNDAVVLPRGTAESQDLVAFIIPAQGQSPEPGTLRAFLQEQLPAYMVPSAYVGISEWPMTASGKLDRKALAALPVSAQYAGGPRSAPQDPLQEALVRIWDKVLGNPSVGVTDNFFDMGGHSLLAAQMFAEIENTLGRSAPVSTLYVAPTIETLSRALEQRAATAGCAATLIRAGGNKPPLFLIHRFREDRLLYVDLVGQMAGDRPVFLVDLRQLDAFAGIGESAQEAIRVIHQVCRQGPYHLAGACAEGLVALEAAQQLAASGEPVGVVTLIDTFRPGMLRSWPAHRRAVYQAQRIGFHIANLRKRGLRRKLEYVGETGGRAVINFRRAISRRLFPFYRATRRELPGGLRDAHELARVAASEYAPRVYDGAAVLVRPAEKHARANFPLDLGWGSLLPRLRVFESPGDHISMLHAPYARNLAVRMEDFLVESETVAPGGGDEIETLESCRL